MSLTTEKVLIEVYVQRNHFLPLSKYFYKIYAYFATNLFGYEISTVHHYELVFMSSTWTMVWSFGYDYEIDNISTKVRAIFGKLPWRIDITVKTEIKPDDSYELAYIGKTCLDSILNLQLLRYGDSSNYGPNNNCQTNCIQILKDIFNHDIELGKMEWILMKNCPKPVLDHSILSLNQFTGNFPQTIMTNNETQGKDNF